MANASLQPKLDVKICFEINESEARALDAIAGYGVDAFVKSFYGVMGTAYLKPHEAGLREFLGTILDTVRPGLTEVSKARVMLQACKKEVPHEQAGQ